MMKALPALCARSMRKSWWIEIYSGLDGLLSQHYPTAALEIMKKEIAYYGHKE